MSTTTAEVATEYDKKQDDRIKKLEDKVFGTTPPPPPPPGGGCGADPDPNDEHIAHGGWGGDMGSPDTWDAVPMKDDPTQWKVVDKQGVNIAHKFASEAEAEKYIAYHECIKEGGDPDPDPPGPPAPPGPPPPPGTTGDGPYPVKGTPKGHTIRGPTTRHYASGKPDDETIEANVKGFNFPNHQFVVDITIKQMEHDDNASLKIGGNHMTNGWFDNGFSIYQGQACLGTEVKHPSTKLCIVKGDKIGDIRNKRVKLAATYFKAQNKTEVWSNIGNGWRKNAEGANIGGFNSNTTNFECQLRIDGFTKGSVPEIHAAWVSEI